MKPKYRIVRTGVFTQLFNVQKKMWWGWKRVLKEQGMSYCTQYCENAINPVVKEY